MKMKNYFWLLLAQWHARKWNLNDEKIFMMMVVAKNSIQMTNDWFKIRKFNFDDDAFNFVMISDKFQKTYLAKDGSRSTPIKNFVDW